MLKKLIYLTISGLLMSAGSGWAAQAPAKPTPTPPPATAPGPIVPLNRIVAIVNDEIISQSDLDTAVDQLKQQMAASNIPAPPENKLRNDALQQLITYRLLLQMATRNQIEATPEEIDQMLEQIAASHKITVDQLKEQLALQHIPYADFRKKISEQLAINRLEQQMVGSQIKVTDEDVAAFKNSNQGGTEEYKLVDFFFPLSAHPTQEELDRARSAAQAVQDKINSGADMSTITPAAIDLGWRTKDNLPEIFVTQLPALTLKNASPPLHAPNGYHVLKLVETHNTIQNLTDDQIRQLVLRQKFEAAAKTAIDKARSQAYIQIIPQ